MNPTIQDQFLTLINRAITSRRVVQFKHRKTWRTVEPYIAGVNKDAQITSFYGFCRDVVPSVETTTNRLWQVFNITDIEEIELTYYEFTPHPDYVGCQDQIYPVYVRLEPEYDHQPVDSFSISY